MQCVSPEGVQLDSVVTASLSSPNGDPPTLLGTLSLDVRRGVPTLTLSVFCPGCRCRHSHSWGFDPTLPPGHFPCGPTHRQSHCLRPSSPYKARGYYVGPDDSQDNAATLARYRRLMDARLARTA